MLHSLALSRLTCGDRSGDMISRALQRAFDKFERDWKYDAWYTSDIRDVFRRALWLFSRVTTLGQFRS